MAATLFLEPISAGNAVRLYVTPAPGARCWTVLRRTADAFTGHDDAGAVHVADAVTDNVVLDATALVNGTPYFYALYSFNGSTWSSIPSVSVTPAATYQGDGLNVLQIVRDRLAAGLAAEVARGTLQPESGKISVVKSPFMLADNVAFPIVSIHVDEFAAAEHFLGDDPLALNDLIPDGDLSDDEGFMARWSMTIAAVSRLPDERNELRRALVRVLQANLPVFGGLGILMPDFRFADSEDLESKAAPLFLTGGSFTCQALSFVRFRVPAITDVITTLTVESPLNVD